MYGTGSKKRGGPRQKMRRKSGRNDFDGCPRSKGSPTRGEGAVREASVSAGAVITPRIHEVLCDKGGGAEGSSSGKRGGETVVRRAMFLPRRACRQGMVDEGGGPEEQDWDGG